MGRFSFRGRDWVKSVFMDSNVVPGSTKTLIQEHVLLGKSQPPPQNLILPSTTCSWINIFVDPGTTLL